MTGTHLTPDQIYRPWKVFVTCFLVLFIATKLYFHWGVPMSVSLRNVIGTVCVLGAFGSFALVMRNVVTDWKVGRYYVPLPARAVLPFEVLMYTLTGLVVIHVGMTLTMADFLGLLPVLLVTVIGILDTQRSRAYYRRKFRKIS